MVYMKLEIFSVPNVHTSSVMLLLLCGHLCLFRARELHRLAELVRTRQDLLNFSMGALYLFFQLCFQFGWPF